MSPGLATGMRVSCGFSIAPSFGDLMSNVIHFGQFQPSRLQIHGIHLHVTLLLQSNASASVPNGCLDAVQDQ
jgi:hypothetical protein